MKENFPIMLGSKPALAVQNETLPTREVANKVVWVNPNLELPFDLKEGEATKLGIFLTPNSETGIPGPKLEITPNHLRSGILCRGIFPEKLEKGQQHELYRDIDIKGAGFAEIQDGRHVVKPVGISPRFDGKTMGIMNLEPGLHDADIAERLHRQGVRTHRVLAVIELKEILDSSGEKITIEEAKRRKIIKESDRPALQIRAFGTKARLADVDADIPESVALVDDARTMVAQELGRTEENFTEIDYLKWLGRVIGKNIGILKRNKLKHYYFGEGHNITLDGRLVDFDTVKSSLMIPIPFRKSSSPRYDLERTRFALENFLNKIFKHREAKLKEVSSDIFRELEEGFQEGTR